MNTPEICTQLTSLILNLTDLENSGSSSFSRMCSNRTNSSPLCQGSNVRRCIFLGKDFPRPLLDSSCQLLVLKSQDSTYHDDYANVLSSHGRLSRLRNVKSYLYHREPVYVSILICEIAAHGYNDLISTIILCLLANKFEEIIDLNTLFSTLLTVLLHPVIDPVKKNNFK
uniref:Uncharacterized protein n=1 Tax=Glossina pallidipes TaxID=7398 RepID=A0A1A9ZH80_GLOPL